MRWILTGLLLCYLLSLVMGYVVASNCGELASGYFDDVARAIERVNK